MGRFFYARKEVLNVRQPHANREFYREFKRICARYGRDYTETETVFAGPCG